MKLYEIIMLVAICILVVFSAFFSSCEIAYSTVSKIRLKKESEKNNKNALAAISIIDNYPILLSTVLVGNNLVNILISSLGTLVAVRHFGEELGPILSTIILTVVVLIFGEIIPKTFGTKYAYRLSLLYTNIFKFFKAIFYPLSFVINKFVSFLLRNYKEDEPIPTATDEELITIAEELEEEGVIDQDDAELIKSAIDFCDVTAHEIMIPRVDVFAINIDDSTDEILNDELIYKYSRVPVYEDTIDNIIGILNTTELIKKVLSNEPIDIRSMLSKPYFVHKTKSISNILTELKKNHLHIAVVIDEFGGVMGILTAEDIIEELIGDVFDEMDEVVLDYEQLDEHTYKVDGDMNIYDFFELIDYDDRDFEAEYTTVGGWCTDILEKFPEVGETFTFANVKVTSREVDKMRVENVKVEIEEIAEDDKK